jgi:hypothetical protein
MVVDDVLSWMPPIDIEADTEPDRSNVPLAEEPFASGFTHPSTVRTPDGKSDTCSDP